MIHKVRHPADCRRILELLWGEGYDVRLRDVEDIWEKHSNNASAGWLFLPESDAELLEALRPYLDDGWRF